MLLHYKAKQSSIESKDGKKKYHPVLVKNEEVISTRKIGEDAAEISSLSPGDMANAAWCLFTVLGRYLRGGYSVRIDGLGTFTLRAKSTGNGVDTPEEVSSSQIKSLRIQFTPEYTRNSFEGTTRAIFQGVKFKRWPGDPTLSGTEPTDPDDGYEQDPNA